MNKLNKKQIERFETIQKELNAAREAVNDAREQIVERIVLVLQGYGQPLVEASERWNAALSDAESFRDELVAEMEDYEGDRAESWGESESGERFAAWKAAWEFDIECGEEDAWEAIALEVGQQEGAFGVDLQIPTIMDLADEWSYLPIEKE